MFAGISFEKIELFVYRAFALIILIYHLIKFFKFELSHW
jgi:hypothetical protein